MKWFRELELWQKIMYADLVFAFAGAIVIFFWLSAYTWITNLYLGIIMATGVAITVVGVIERRRRGEKLMGRRGQKVTK